MDLRVSVMQQFTSTQQKTKTTKPPKWLVIYLTLESISHLVLLKKGFECKIYMFKIINHSQAVVNLIK